MIWLSNNNINWTIILDISNDNKKYHIMQKVANL